MTHHRFLLVATAVFLSPSALPAAVTVNSVEALKAAIDRVNADSNADRTILIEDGVHRLKWPHLSIERDGVVIAGKSGQRNAVVLQGQHGMNGGRIEFIFQVNADDVTIRDLTLEDVGSHAVIIHGEAPHDADRTTLRNLVIRDTSIIQVIDLGTTNIERLPVPFTDFDGRRRPQGKAIDIGADEYQMSPRPEGVRF